MPLFAEGTSSNSGRLSCSADLWFAACCPGIERARNTARNGGKPPDKHRFALTTCRKCLRVKPSLPFTPPLGGTKNGSLTTEASLCQESPVSLQQDLVACRYISWDRAFWLPACSTVQILREPLLLLPFGQSAHMRFPRRNRFFLRWEMLSGQFAAPEWRRPHSPCPTATVQPSSAQTAGVAQASVPSPHGASHPPS